MPQTITPQITPATDENATQAQRNLRMVQILLFAKCLLKVYFPDTLLIPSLFDVSTQRFT